MIGWAIAGAAVLVAGGLVAFAAYVRGYDDGHADALNGRGRDGRGA